jgi:tetratricopeptide (TPR) repeat protein
MKTPVLPFVFLSFMLAVVWLSPATNLARLDAPDILSTCGYVPAGETVKNEQGKYVVALPGRGDHAYKITTASDSAQFYFNQGLTMYYSYHVKESVASFKEASRFDPGCAMAFWGQALAMGPYYNAAHTYEVPAGITAVLQLMKQHMAKTTPKEKSLIKAMSLRYPEAVFGDKEKALDGVYASEMKRLSERYPDDADIQSLYIDAVMLMHAWDFWDPDGTPRPWTPEVADLCAKVLKKNPRHPAVLHYYIHLTEASRHPGVALANADALKTLFPGVPHMVHMASHAYQRKSLYFKGVEVNDLADDNLMTYQRIAGNLGLNKHSPHYFAVQSYCALTGGMYKIGLQNAIRCRNAVSPTYESTYDQYLFMMPVMTMVRLGKWEQILEDHAAPRADWPYAHLLHHFARGLAFVNTNQKDSARVQLSALRSYQEDAVLLKRRIPFNSPAQMGKIAERILTAAICFVDQKYEETTYTLAEAINIEDKLIYTEPNDWPLPARQFLGAYLLRLGKAGMAEQVYEEDLAIHPDNGWSLLGMYQSLNAQKKKADLPDYKERYLRAFVRADEIPDASVYLR